MQFYIKIFTDGSCLGNPGPGGYGVVLQKFDSKKKKLIIEAELDGGEKDSTNNRMEILAPGRAMEFLLLKKIKNSHVDIYTDSNLVYSTYVKKWNRKTNQDMWAITDKALARLVADGNRVTWNWVKAHSGHPENERCDEIARTAAGYYK